MSVVPAPTNLYLEALVVGLIYGSTFCSSSCLPYIAGYIAGVGAGFKRGIKITLFYNSGRMVAYAVIGGLIGILSGIYRFLINEESIASFQQYSSYIFGFVTIAIGASLFLKSRKSSCVCDGKEKMDQQNSVDNGPKFDFRAFTLGLTRGLVVCTPLVLLMLATVPIGTPVDSLLVAVFFGLGTSISPLLLLGGVTGWLLNKAPLLSKWISIGGAMVLIMLGVGTLITAVLTI